MKIAYANKKYHLAETKKFLLHISLILSICFSDIKELNKNVFYISSLRSVILFQVE